DSPPIRCRPPLLIPIVALIETSETNFPDPDNKEKRNTVTQGVTSASNVEDSGAFQSKVTPWN
ncbi:MAG: hypothetical protein AAFY31_18740, partial [Pseudomonadota bacterium]